ncbi:hypothetical protein VP01_7725g1, partial [Puccinia sorghi]
PSHLCISTRIVIFFENGQSGFNVEHSCMDGTPVARINNWMLDMLSNKKIDLVSSSDSNLPPPTPIEFVLSDASKKKILNVLEYSGYGKCTIKNEFKTSPDAIAQLIMQLGQYKLFSRGPVTYESCQTRNFKPGRTEMI